MAVEEDIYSALSSYAGLSALVSARIYPIKAKQKPTYPLIVYRRISNNELNSLDGGGKSNSRYQFSVYASSYTSARLVRDQIKLAMAASSLSNVLISDIDLDFNDEPEKYSIVLDYSLWHN